MSVGRYRHTATALGDGKVLVAGGTGNLLNGEGGCPIWGPLSSSEIYDPATGRFAPGPTMTRRRAGHTATLLPSGKVVLTGGESVCGEPDSSAEIYDPTTGTFAAAGAMLAARAYHTATLLPDGSVLLAGGDASLGPIGYSDGRTAELYDPKTGTFSAKVDFRTPKSLHTATLLPNGMVLIAGTPGFTSTDPAARDGAELYNPSTQTFAVTGAMVFPRHGHAATLLADGRVLLVGGNLSSESSQAEIYEPTTGVFSATGSLTSARTEFTASLLLSGRVLVAGGGTETEELYDPTTGQFAATVSMNDSRRAHSATLLENGEVLHAGGHISSEGEPQASAEIFSEKATCTTTPDGGLDGQGSASGPAHFSLTGSLLVPRTGHTSSLLDDGTVLLAGGTSQSDGGIGLLDEAELYEPAQRTFSATGRMVLPRTRHSATLLADRRVLIVGGAASNVAEIYDPAQKAFLIRGSTMVERTNHSATLLPNGKVLVAGGSTSDGKVDVSSAELFEATTGISVPTGSMTASRSGHAAISLDDGTVLIAGGTSEPSAELYSPSTGKFSALVGSKFANKDSVATKLLDGRVLISRGANFYAPRLGASELYDPATRTFKTAGDWPASLGSFTSTLLASGDVLLAGAYRWGLEIPHCETHVFLYHALSETFSMASQDPLVPIRAGGTATRLADGAVLISGGSIWNSYCGGSFPADALLYQ